MDGVLRELFKDWNKERPRAVALGRVKFNDLEKLDGLQQAGYGETGVVVEDGRQTLAEDSTQIFGDFVFLPGQGWGASQGRHQREWRGNAQGRDTNFAVVNA